MSLAFAEVGEEVRQPGNDDLRFGKQHHDRAPAIEAASMVKNAASFLRRWSIAALSASRSSLVHELCFSSAEAVSTGEPPQHVSLRLLAAGFGVSSEPMPRLDDASRKSLLQQARAAIAHAIGVERVPHPQPLIPEGLRAGAFVTIRMGGHLRGCIGYPDPELPLIEVVERCAVSAAISDPRFPALSVAEWREIDVEVSVLGPIEPVADIAEVIIGRHGLIVEFGRRRGLLLPQVATEWKWTAVEFASETCVKAGLPADAWQKGAKLFKFEADVFGESDCITRQRKSED